MKKPANWEKIEAKEKGEFILLPSGAYKCEIKDAHITKSKKGNEMILLMLDIVEGEYKGYFENLYEISKKISQKEPVWKCIYHQLIENENIKYFKGLIKAIEKSNKGFKFDFEEKKLIGKSCCGIFRREEVLYNEEVLLLSKCYKITSLDKMKEGIKAPKDKLLNLKNN